MANIIETNGNDTLVGSNLPDTINDKFLAINSKNVKNTLRELLSTYIYRHIM